MPSTNNINVFKELVVIAGSVVVSSGLYYGAVMCWGKFISACFALSKISKASNVPISDLHSLISPESNEHGLESSKEMLVIVRGVTKENIFNRQLVSSLINSVKCIVLEQIWGSFPNLERKTSLRNSPFILCGDGSAGADSNEVLVDLEGSNHIIPMQVCKPHPLNVLPTSGSEYLVREQFLPVGMDISVVGICSLQHGKPQIRACKDLPMFLTTMTRDEMIEFLIEMRNNFFIWSVSWEGISICILIINVLPRILRLWGSWKQKREARIGDTESMGDDDDESDGEMDTIDGQ